MQEKRSAFAIISLHYIAVIIWSVRLSVPSKPRHYLVPLKDSKPIFYSLCSKLKLLTSN